MIRLDTKLVEADEAPWMEKQEVEKKLQTILEEQVTWNSQLKDIFYD